MPSAETAGLQQALDVAIHAASGKPVAAEHANDLVHALPPDEVATISTRIVVRVTGVKDQKTLLHHLDKPIKRLISC